MRVDRLKANALSPSVLAPRALSNAARVTDTTNAFAIVIEYSGAFAEIFEAVKVLVTESSMEIYAGLFGADMDGDFLLKPSAMMSRYRAWDT